MDEAISMDKLEPGDCLISFSKKEVIRYKMQINSKQQEGQFEKQCSIIYGALPPETKKLQAKLFNEENNQMNYLVATDAIGLGLNLNIKRIIFTSVRKFNSVDQKVGLITPAHLKQIAGRAGRSDRVGYVSALNYKDLTYIKECISQSSHMRGGANERVEAGELIVNGNDMGYQFTKTEAEIRTAIIFPPLDVIIDFASTLNNFYAKDKSYIQDDLVTILEKFEFFSQIDELYSFRNIQSYVRIATALRVVPDASLRNVLIFTMSPVKESNRVINYLKIFLRDLVKKSIVLIPIDLLVAVSNFDINTTKKNYLENLQLFEDLHNSNVLFI
jgi:hypothetical protein